MIKKLNTLGPGLLYASAAVGVSHLIQSTRAGALFGFEFLLIIILCHIVKYPFFQFAPSYSKTTGKSLLEGYKEVGTWAVYLFLVMTFVTMFIIQAAVTIVTAGISINLFSLDLSAIHMSIIILILSFIILVRDKFSQLDLIVKIIISLLTLTTVFCATLAATIFFTEDLSVDISLFRFNKLDLDFSNSTHLVFLAAFIGWMPAPLDVPVWQSLWTLSKSKSKSDSEVAESQTRKSTKVDFLVGYLGTALLGALFLSLGAFIIYGKGVELSSSAVGFTKQLIELYTSTLGVWSYPLIGLCALTTMLSTTLTCLDAFSRVLSEGGQILKLGALSKVESQKSYRVWLLITILGTSLLLLFFTENMKELVDFATITSFTMAPAYAFLSYKVMLMSSTPEVIRVKGAYKTFTQVCLFILLCFSLYYLIII